MLNLANGYPLRIEELGAQVVFLSGIENGLGKIALPGNHLCPLETLAIDMSGGGHFTNFLLVDTGFLPQRWAALSHKKTDAKKDIRL